MKQMTVLIQASTPEIQRHVNRSAAELRDLRTKLLNDTPLSELSFLRGDFNFCITSLQQERGYPVIVMLDKATYADETQRGKIVALMGSDAVYNYTDPRTDFFIKRVESCVWDYARNYYLKAAWIRYTVRVGLEAFVLPKLLKEFFTAGISYKVVDGVTYVLPLEIQIRAMHNILKVFETYATPTRENEMERPWDPEGSEAQDFVRDYNEILQEDILTNELLHMVVTIHSAEKTAKNTYTFHDGSRAEISFEGAKVVVTA